MCGRLVNLDTVARVLAEYYHLKTDTQLAALDEALSKVPAVSVVGGHGKDHVADPGKMVGDLISRAGAIETVRKAKSIGQAHRMLVQLPSVDAVPVLCKDCKHRDPEDRKCDCGHDIMWQLPRGDDWYCADGERKDGDGSG